MEIRLTRESDGPWATLAGPMHPRFAAAIRAMPRGVWSQAGGKFRVHCSKLHAVTVAARAFYDRIDWSTLPAEWQVLACGGTARSTPGEDPYAVLHLLPTAPLSVARAAHKALAMDAHPDRGGSDGEMQRLNAALAAISSRIQ